MVEEGDNVRFLDNVYFSGWDYRKPLPSGIAEANNLQDDDPWIVFCCILERAKQGDFHHVDRLKDHCRIDDIVLRHAAQYLLACVGREEQLRVLDADILCEDGAYRMEAADHAAVSGSLRFVDAFIKGYHLAFKRLREGSLGPSRHHRRPS
jgi:hypothetical protein